MNWKSIFLSITIAANCLLCFFLVFYDGLAVPSLLQVVGRAHPLFLHFPIVLFALFLLWVWVVPKRSFHSPELYEKLGKWLLLATAFTSAITALMGIFLSKESGYNADGLFWHKWTGALVSIITFLWYLFYDQLDRRKISLATASVISVLILVVAGHAGASITHGDNFLLAPVIKEKIKKRPPLAEAVVYDDMVYPILESRCLSCHNSTKAKGELVMETKQLLVRGGKSGTLWDTSDANLSLILQRIHLPLEDKKHMPPENKPQMTEQEITILYNWIRDGANFKVKVTELEPTDTLRAIAGNMFRSSDEEENYEFSHASEETIKKLNTNYRSVYPIAKESPAIAVDFYGAAFYNHQALEDLLGIKTQLVSLNLDKMPVTDADMKTIGQLTNLRKLNISFSKITGDGLSELGKLEHLKDFSLTNTALKKDDIQKLLALKSIRHIYIWNCGFDLADVQAIRKKYPLLDIETGMRTDTMFIKLNAPLVQNENPVIDSPVHLKLKHYVPQTVIRYTLDGTEPDSLHSLVYNNRVMVGKQVLMTAKAFKKGWHASDPVQFQFYTATYKPDTIVMLKPADSSYRGKGGNTLKDLVKGNQDFGDGKWIAFRKNNMECLMKFPSPVRPEKITISSLVNVGAMIYPPKNISIYGGMDPGNLKLIYHVSPPKDTLMQSNYLMPYDCVVKKVPVKYLKVIVEPIGELPKKPLTEQELADLKAASDKAAKEAAAKGEKVAKKKPEPPKINKGWFFIDEIFVN
jgi:uncharacterized membrane protein